MTRFNNNVTIPFYYLLYLLKIKKYEFKTIDNFYCCIFNVVYILCFEKEIYRYAKWPFAG